MEWFDSAKVNKILTELRTEGADTDDCDVFGTTGHDLISEIELSAKIPALLFIPLHELLFLGRFTEKGKAIKIQLTSQRFVSVFTYQQCHRPSVQERG